MKTFLKIGLTALAIFTFQGQANAQAGKCDLDKMRHYPVTSVLASRSIPLQTPELFFPDENTNIGLSDKTAEDEANARAALERGLRTFPEEERGVLMLAAADKWTSAPDGLAVFFVLQDGLHLDKVLTTLDEMGLKAHADMLREGRAMFGNNYGLVAQRYARWSDGHGNILDLELDQKLERLSQRFKKLPRLIDIAAEKISASKQLQSKYRKFLKEVPDDERIQYLVSSLYDCLSNRDNLELRRALARLPPAYADFFYVADFEMEMLNGSVEQYFYNSAGNFAPELVDALKRMNLTSHAATIERAIAKFPSPYPVDRTQRTAFMELQGKAMSEWLNNLTAQMDDGAIRKAMIEQARSAWILPE